MQKNILQSILIYADGACSGNPGPGGWACIIATPEGSVKELGGAKDRTTNNEMELTAAIRALQHIKNIHIPVYIFTDSTYVIRGITQWIWGWQKKDWKTAEGNDVANQEYWKVLFSLTRARGKKNNVQWKYCRGHRGIPGNERCDEIAVHFSKGRWIDLYEGPLLQYAIPIYDTPKETELPEMKPRETKVSAHSYLSYVGNEVYRHRDWASCERRVKGKSGAKFKKALSAEDEKIILMSWGLANSVLIKEQ